MASDLRGNPTGTGSAPALACAERALWRMMSFYDTPLADLDGAIDADPAWPLPRVMKAGYLLSLTEAPLLEEASRLLDQACALPCREPREQAHLAATRHVLGGLWHEACVVWEALLIEHPRDALALQWVQLWDFYRGDLLGLRQRPARALPEWDEADPLFPYVLGLYAFGLEENNLYAQAEEAGRRAVAPGPWGQARVPWAVHAVAHVMEMQGRVDHGAAWLRSSRPDWVEGNGFAVHLWWHSALFRLEGLDHAGVLRLVDNHLGSESMQADLQRLDKVSLLWRLQLLGIDVQARFAALVDDWPLQAASAGHHAFNDLHVLLALLGAGQTARAESWLAQAAQRTLAAEDARRANHRVAREVGLPLMRGMLAFAQGDFEAAGAQLMPARGRAQRLGGSHAQRDLIDQTLLACAARGRQHALGRALLNERLMARAPTPLARHWAEQLGVPERVALG